MLPPPDHLFTSAHGEQVHPHAISQTFERLAARADVPLIRLHDLRHTIKAGVPVKVVSERLGHADAAFTIETYQHVLPGMQADAARTCEQLVAQIDAVSEKSTGEAPEEERLNPVEARRNEQGPGR